MSTRTVPTELPDWKTLESESQTLKATSLRALFESDPGRGERMVADGAGIFLDYSKNRVTDRTLSLLLSLARASELEARRDAMFSGEKINVTEGRAVLHTALRAPRDADIRVDGKNVVPDVHAVLDEMAAFAERVRSGAFK